MKTTKTAAAKQTFKHMPHVAWRRVEEESVLLNVDTSDYYSLDPVGTEIWEGLGRGETPDEISETLARDYGIPLDRAAKDAKAFIANLLKEGLIHQAD